MEKRSPKMSDNIEGFLEPEVNWSKYETSFRRWLVSEIELGHMTVNQAKERFQLPLRFDVTFREWQRKYSSAIHVSLRIMTQEEITEFKKLQERIAELEEIVEKAQIKNVLMETMVDIAEKEFKIDIRKKPGPKQ